MPQAAQMPVGRPPPALLVMTGPMAGQRVALHHGFMIGKQPGCHLLIDDGFTSSQHAQIGIDAAGNCRLYDRGSTNGTFINGVPIRETALEHGATIRIGSTELRFLAQ
jgi:predicted component of type VI protein secretion system